MYSVTSAAKHLGVSRQYVLFLVRNGRLNAEKVGCTWVVHDLTITPNIKTQKFTAVLGHFLSTRELKQMDGESITEMLKRSDIDPTATILFKGHLKPQKA